MEVPANRNRRPYNGAALSPETDVPPPASSTGASPHGIGYGVEHRLAQLFPRHHLQGEFMHIGAVAAFLMALIWFVVGLFYAHSWLGTNFFSGSVFLLH